jgi:cell division septation protein DedD
VRHHSFALALVLAGCSSSDDRGATASKGAPTGPDAIVLRVAAEGGVARAYRYPALDSLLWTTKAALPAQIKPLGFSSDGGTLALSDAAGTPWRLTLGSGALERAYPTPLIDLASLDGTGIFGASANAVLRFTTTEATPWQVTTTASIAQLQPLRDGGVLVIAQRGAQTVLSRFRPPDATPVDTALLDGKARLISAAGGDRYYLSDGPRRLVSFRARDLERLNTISLGDSILATVSSPSGDRVYVLGRDDTQDRLQVINKYSDEIVAKLDMPPGSSALRMDPLGRYVLVRHAGALDSVLVVSIATDKVVGRLSSPWRADLPLVLPDGRLATLRGDDVVTLSAEEFRPLSVIAGGAKDIWTVIQWNGFRRRPGDAPLRATVASADTARKASPDSTAASAARRDSIRSVGTADSAAVPKTSDSTVRRPLADSAGRRLARIDSLRRAIARTDSVRRAGRADSARRTPTRTDSQARSKPAPAPDPPATLGTRGTFVVQFAALKAEQPARQLASAIRANGERARVVTTMSNGITLYRVILGPFPSRADAERAGQAAGRDYWVFEGGSN